MNLSSPYIRSVLTLTFIKTRWILYVWLLCQQHISFAQLSEFAFFTKDSSVVKTNILRADSIKPDSNIHSKLFNKLPQFICKPSGRTSFESYYTTFQNPRVLTEKQYLRIQGSNSVKLLGIPLLVDYYHTSENQSLYNSSYFKVQFDYQTYINGIKEDWKKTLNSTTQQLNADKIQKQQESKLQSAVSQQMDNLTKQKSKLTDLLAEKQLAYNQKYSGIGDSLESGITDSINRRVLNNTQSAQDSLSILRLKADTSRIARKIDELSDIYQKISAKKVQLDSAIAKDSAQLLHYKELLSDPQAHATQWLRSKNLPSGLVFLSSLRDFKIGMTQPVIHPYSIYGIGIKGFQTSYSTKNGDLTLASGKAIVSDLSNYSRNIKEFDRFFLAAQYKFDITSNLRITVFGHHSRDPEDKFTKDGRTAFQNSNIGLGAIYRFRKGPELQWDAVTSWFRSLNTTVVNYSTPGNSTISGSDIRLASSAAMLSAQQNITKWMDLSATAQFVGPRFRNLGNPFMRTNFLEEQVKSKFRVLKEQLSITGFYKRFADNPLKYSEVTNITSGYGLSFQTRFKNRQLPNFNGSVSPYEQGNNHPDSLFRANSRYSVITAGMTYRTGRRIKYSLMAFGSQSNMQFNDSFSALVRTLTVSNDLMIGKNLSLGLSSTFMRTYPAVDSSQANIHQARLSYRLGKFTTITATGFYAQYQNGAYRKGGSLIISTPAGKHIRLSLRAGYDHYYKLWGLGDKEAFWGVGRVEWIW